MWPLRKRFSCRELQLPRKKRFDNREISIDFMNLSYCNNKLTSIRNTPALDQERLENQATWWVSYHGNIKSIFNLNTFNTFSNSFSSYSIFSKNSDTGVKASHFSKIFSLPNFGFWFLLTREVLHKLRGVVKDRSPENLALISLNFL